MHGRKKRDAQSAEQRKREPIDVGMDHVEVGCPSRNRFQQETTGGARVDGLSSKTQRARPYRVKLGARPGIPARKKVTLCPSSTSSSTSQATTRSALP